MIRTALLALMLACPAMGQSVYHVGNSLTNDARVGGLEALTGFDHDFHIQCGTSLSRILSHPITPCVLPETPWPDTDLAAYDALILQPHPGATWAAELAAVVAFAAAAPDAEIFVYATWRRQDDGPWDRPFDGAAARFHQHAAGYDWLMSELAVMGVEAELIRAGHAFDAAGGGPELYRDVLHSSFDVGQPLAASVMAEALASVPEPGSLLLVTAGGPLLLHRKASR